LSQVARAGSVMRCSTSKVPQLVQLYSYVGMSESITSARGPSRGRAYPFSTTRTGNLLRAEQTIP
jgi:hypothetical protein